VVPPNLEVHVVLDNLSAHKLPVVRRWLLRNQRFQFHFTPTYSSWLNLVERFFGLLASLNARDRSQVIRRIEILRSHLRPRPVVEDARE
jgi:transposase